MRNVRKIVAALFAVVLVLTAGCGKKSGGKVVDYDVPMPMGFEETEQENVDKMWKDADGSSINVKITEKISDFETLTADALREAMIESFDSAYGVKPTITDKYFTRTEVCGLPAIQYCFTIELAGVEMTQLMVSVNADKNYAFTYTETAGGDWMNDFEDSAKKIQLITD